MYNIDAQYIGSLITELSAYRARAYVPYSHFPVCALLIDEEGRKHFGVNVENASYGLTVCAERNALCSALTQGMKHIALMAVAADTPEPVMPCGACRQMLAEFCTEQSLIVCANFKGLWQPFSISGLLPCAFTPKDLNHTPQGDTV